MSYIKDLTSDIDLNEKPVSNRELFLRNTAPVADRVEPVAPIYGYFGNHPDNAPGGVPDYGGTKRKKRKRRAKKVKPVYNVDSEITLRITAYEGDEVWKRGAEMLLAAERWGKTIIEFMQSEFVANHKRRLPFLQELVEWSKQFWSKDCTAEWLTVLPESTVRSTVAHLHKWAWEEHRATSKLPDWSKWQTRLHYNSDLRYHEHRGLRLTKFYVAGQKRKGWVSLMCQTNHATKKEVYAGTFLAKHYLHMKSASVWLGKSEDGAPALLCRIKFHSISHAAPEDPYHRPIEYNDDGTLFFQYMSKTDSEVYDAFMKVLEEGGGRMHSTAIVAKLAEGGAFSPRLVNGAYEKSARTLTERSLAWHLRNVGIKPTTLRINGKLAKGYDVLSELADRKADAERRLANAQEELDELSAATDAGKRDISSEKQDDTGVTDRVPYTKSCLRLSKEEDNHVHLLCNAMDQFVYGTRSVTAALAVSQVLSRKLRGFAFHET